MPTPADLAALTAARGRPKAVRSGHSCAHPACRTQIHQPRYACPQHWLELPRELRERIKAAQPRKDGGPLLRNHPFRVAAREAKTVWGNP